MYRQQTESALCHERIITTIILRAQKINIFDFGLNIKKI